MSRVLAPLLAAALSGCFLLPSSQAPQVRTRSALVVLLPVDRAADALDPSLEPAPDIPARPGERVFASRGGTTQTVVRLRAASDTTALLLIDATARSRSPSPLSPPVWSGDEPSVRIALSGVGDCPSEPPVFTRTPPAADPDVVGVPPQLIGGLEGLAARVRYPETARRADMQGTVFVRFVVERDGSIGCADVVGGSWDLLDAEALRVVRESQFTPGSLRGEPVRVRYTLPIRFTLR